MATLEPILSTINSSSPPWKFLGSVSSVSPVSSFQDVTVSTTAKTQESYNGTGYYIDDDGESMLNDLKTVVIACIATLVPLVVTLVTIFGIRILWIHYKTRKKARHFDGVLVKDNTNTSESISKPLHSHLLNDKGSAETHLEISTEAVEICEDVSSSSNNRSSNVNGSIITMTLKNNHLIVETEERNDIEEDSRETTMRYSPSARDGVFVVEVQQGVRRSPGSGDAPSLAEPERSGSLSDQCALVHNPPEKFSDEETLEECDDSEYYVETSPEKLSDLPSVAKTGLSTSNTSLNSIRQSYCYSNQFSYDQGRYGYNDNFGYTNDSAPGRVLESNNKPKITSALYKSNPGRNVKSMSFDVATDDKERLREKFVLAQNTSLDNVLESNGIDEYSSNLYKSKLLMDNDVNLNKTSDQGDKKNKLGSE